MGVSVAKAFALHTRARIRLRQHTHTHAHSAQQRVLNAVAFSARLCKTSTSPLLCRAQQAGVAWSMQTPHPQARMGACPKQKLHHQPPCRSPQVAPTPLTQPPQLQHMIVFTRAQLQQARGDRRAADAHSRHSSSSSSSSSSSDSSTCHSHSHKQASKQASVTVSHTIKSVVYETAYRYLLVTRTKSLFPFTLFFSP